MRSLFSGEKCLSIKFEKVIKIGNKKKKKNTVQVLHLDLDLYTHGWRREIATVKVGMDQMAKEKARKEGKGGGGRGSKNHS